MVAQHKPLFLSSLQRPTTLSHCGNAPDHVEVSILEEQYQVVNMDGMAVSAMFNQMTQIALVEENYGKPPSGYKYKLVFGDERPRILKKRKTKLRNLFNGCLSDIERQIMVVLAQTPENECI